MKMFCHMLGYSRAEGGINYINSDEAFSMGSVNIETWDRDFDDFEFKVPMSALFNVKPSNNSACFLLSDLAGDETNSIIKLSDDMTLFVGQFLWIENERIKITETNVDSNPLKYRCDRGQHGSIPVCHFASGVVTEQADLVATTSRINPIGLIVKIYDNLNKIYAYGQITELSMLNSGFVEVKCKNIYSQIENDVLIPSQYSGLSLANGCRLRLNEFFALLVEPSLKIRCGFKGETLEYDSRYMVFSNNKDGLNQMLSLNNSIIIFHDGLYRVINIGRTGNKIPTKLKLSDHLVINDGVVSFSVVTPYKSVKIEIDGEDKPFELHSSDSNFTRDYTSSKSCSMSVKDVTLFDGYNESMLWNIATDKLYFLNNIYEKMEITSYKFSHYFVVGEYYDFIDIFKYVSFYNVITERIFLCIGYDENKVTFVRIPNRTIGYVAPSLVFRKTDTSKYTVVNVEDELSYSFFNNQIIDQLYVTNNSDISLMKNVYTDEFIFEVDDSITLVDTEGSLYTGVIINITDGDIYTNTDHGDNGDLFIITIQSNTSYSSLLDKNKVYLYEGVGLNM